MKNIKVFPKQIYKNMEQYVPEQYKNLSKIKKKGQLNIEKNIRKRKKIKVTHKSRQTDV